MDGDIIPPRMTAPGGSKSVGWSDAWPDAIAFAAGLALAWFGEWQTKDLVWSLWLSSLLVGYAMIVWNIFGPVLLLVRGTTASAAPPLARAGADGLFLFGGLFMLAFFTFHFGMFHFVHSVFLNLFFPMLPAQNAGPSVALYTRVFQEYWPFVLVAAVAERQSFRLPAQNTTAPDISVKAADVNRRLANQKAGMNGMMAPYRNVIRLHLLIFFFAFTHFAKLDNFLVYTVVYAVYFFPWRLIKRSDPQET